MAHNEWGILNKLLRCIDDERNDIFLHIDLKSELPVQKFYKPLYSNFYLTDRFDIQWGGDSQVKCELNLLEQATQTNDYIYYHLISGVDLPIKSQNEIHTFFEKNKGKNYIKIDPAAMKSGYGTERIKYYYFLQNLLGRKKGHIAGLLWRVNKIFLKLQKIFKINRLKKCSKKIYKGTNWFSITGEMAKLVITERDFIKKYCYHSLCADEIFLQTIAMNSSLRDTVEDEDLRCIDWKRGNPYIWKIEDVEYLLSQETNIFARKFSEKEDKMAADKIVEAIVS